MNNYETNSNGALVTPAPLFASVWLALFNVLRKNFNERNLAEAANTKSSRQQSKGSQFLNPAQNKSETP